MEQTFRRTEKELEKDQKIVVKHTTKFPSAVLGIISNASEISRDQLVRELEDRGYKPNTIKTTIVPALKELAKQGLIDVNGPQNQFPPNPRRKRLSEETGVSYNQIGNYRGWLIAAGIIQSDGQGSIDFSEQEKEVFRRMGFYMKHENKGPIESLSLVVKEVFGEEAQKIYEAWYKEHEKQVKKKMKMYDRKKRAKEIADRPSTERVTAENLDAILLYGNNKLKSSEITNKALVERLSRDYMREHEKFWELYPLNLHLDIFGLGREGFIKDRIKIILESVPKQGTFAEYRQKVFENLEAALEEFSRELEKSFEVALTRDLGKGKYADKLLARRLEIIDALYKKSGRTRKLKDVGEEFGGVTYNPIWEAKEKGLAYLRKRLGEKKAEASLPSEEVRTIEETPAENFASESAALDYLTLDDFITDYSLLEQRQTPRHDWMKSY